MDNVIKISVLLALYNPKIPWLVDLLESLNNQTYKQITLLAWNDNPVDLYDYEKLFQRYITNFSFQIITGKNNMGSNAVFEKLTKLAKTQYIAYCDQDDIWEPQKLEELIKAMEAYDANLICSDMYVINSSGEIIADSISKIRKRQRFIIGKNQFKFLLAKNFVTGCTTLVNSKFAKNSLPFPDVFFHDWWLALNASAVNSLFIVYKPLIKYRIHSNNQTQPLGDIIDKKSYTVNRINLLKKRVNWLLQQFNDKINRELIHNYMLFIKYREQYLQYPNIKNAYNVISLSSYDRLSAFFEIFLPLVPEKIFSRILMKIQQNKF